MINWSHFSYLDYFQPALDYGKNNNLDMMKESDCCQQLLGFLGHIARTASAVTVLTFVVKLQLLVLGAQGLKWKHYNLVCTHTPNVYIYTSSAFVHYSVSFYYITPHRFEGEHVSLYLVVYSAGP